MVSVVNQFPLNCLPAERELHSSLVALMLRSACSGIPAARADTQRQSTYKNSFEFSKARQSVNSPCWSTSCIAILASVAVVFGLCGEAVLFVWVVMVNKVDGSTQSVTKSVIASLNSG